MQAEQHAREALIAEEAVNRELEATRAALERARGEITTVDGEGDTAAAPSAGARTPPYHCTVMRKAIVRSGPEATDSVSGKLAVGDVVEVLQRAVSSQGVERVRLAAGWTSEMTNGGATVLAPHQSEVPVPGAAPLSAPAPARETGQGPDMESEPESDVREDVHAGHAHAGHAHALAMRTPWPARRALVR